MVNYASADQLVVDAELHIHLVFFFLIPIDCATFVGLGHRIVCLIGIRGIGRYRCSGTKWPLVSFNVFGNRTRVKRIMPDSVER